jgi:DNA-nicking Smr family endonuclease
MAPKHSSDRALWQRATRDVKRLRARSEPPAPPPKRAVKKINKISGPLRPAAALPPLTLDRFAGVDRANAERLKRGRRAVEARLDLHGMTQAEAHRALGAFISASRANGKRCVLVITGRGSMGAGVLRSAVPRWLDEPEFRPHLLAIATAQPQDGGNGALYVMLRRTRAG